MKNRISDYSNNKIQCERSELCVHFKKMKTNVVPSKTSLASQENTPELMEKIH